MLSKIRTTIAILTIGSGAAALHAQTTIDITDYSSLCTGKSSSAVCEESFAAAISAANTALLDNPDDVVTITIPGQKYDFSDEGIPAASTYPVASAVQKDKDGNSCKINKLPPAAIILDGINYTGSGGLIIKGGDLDVDGNPTTILVTNNLKKTISGNNTSHITIQNIKFTRKNYTVTQGTVVDVGPGYVTLAIQDGFPTPLKIMNLPPDGYQACGYNPYLAGRFLMSYDYSDPSNPTPTGGDGDRTQFPVAWGNTSTDDNNPNYVEPAQDANGNWKIYLNDPNLTPSYAIGDVVAVKSKQSADAYAFDNRPISTQTGDLCNYASDLGCPTNLSPQSTDIIFDYVTWARQARGDFRGGFHNVQVTHSSVSRETVGSSNIVAALSTPAGGPQFNQPCDPLPASLATADKPYYLTYDNLVSNYNAVGTGDDSLAIFNEDPDHFKTIVRLSSMADSFDHDLLLEEVTTDDVDYSDSVYAPYTVTKGCSTE